MLLSTSHNFIFVHVPKTAGSSLHRVLEPYDRTSTRTLWRSFSRRLPVTESPERAHFRIHATATEIRAKLSPDVYDRFLSFAVVRNPFDHAVSHFEYMKQYRSQRIAQRFARMSFLEYLELRARLRRPWERLFLRMPDQSYFLVDTKDNLLVNRVIRFEALATEFRDLATVLNLDFRELPSVNRTRSRAREQALEDHYGTDAEAMVRRIYARDFELFGYDLALPIGSPG